MRSSVIEAVIDEPAFTVVDALVLVITLFQKLAKASFLCGRVRAVLLAMIPCAVVHAVLRDVPRAVVRVVVT